jgi:hypothetical protein
MGSVASNASHGKQARALAVARQALAAALALLDVVESGCSEADGSSDVWVALVPYLRGVLPARAVNSAAASGQISGARKVGKRWVSRRVDVDAWLSASGREQPKTSGDAVLFDWERRSERREGGRR